jgi:hypothetical protein
MWNGAAREARTVIISVIASSVFVAVPATAAIVATNSDKVDGKHAVGAKASKEDRAKKLVATGKDGLLPNDILALAPDSNLLDGKDSSEFMTAGSKASDSNLLDGKDSSEFMGAGSKASDSELLDGKDSSQFMSSDDAWAYVISGGGLHASSGNIQVTHPAVGEYCVVVTKRYSHKAAQVTLADPAGTKIMSVGTGHGSACNPLSTDTHDAIPVYAKTTAGAAVDANFTVYVPAP